MKNTLRKAASVVLLAILLSACAVTRTPPIYRVALLTSFEGRYREIGYNALYAARLAFADFAGTRVELMPIDDGGSVETAVLRARALTYDPQVIGALVLGYHAADPQAQAAFADIPVIIVGRWTESRAAENVFILSSRDIHTPLDEVTTPIETPYEGGDLWLLEGARRLRESLDGITVVTSGSPPDAAFTERYKAGNAFAPEPNLLAALVYDSAAVLIRAAQSGERAAAFRVIGDGNYDGMNGAIRFGDDGFWDDAPIHRYRYPDGAWVSVESIE
jgi:ABC-type branched-subunit amino acid transport system substrate-binding protein